MAIGISLRIMAWVEGWPIIGEVLPQQIGTMVWSGKMPYEYEEKLTLKRSDDFDEASLGSAMAMELPAS